MELDVDHTDFNLSQWQLSVLSSRRLTPKAKLVAMTLALHMDKAGECQIAAEIVAEVLKIKTANNVHDYMMQLVRAKLVTRERVEGHKVWRTIAVMQ
jgi:hypothetical protein